MIYKRIKKTTAKPSDPALVEKAKNDITRLKAREKEEGIDLYYFDESGFSLTPSVPYAWQDRGKNNRIRIPSAGSKRINLAGLLSPSKEELKSWKYEGKINSNRVIEIFEDLSQDLEKETWVILDNASFHCSNAIKARRKQWEKRGLYLYYLPPYSPHLNLIERLWQFMKYQWITFSAYTSFASLHRRIDEVLLAFGNKYKINFA